MVELGRNRHKAYLRLRDLVRNRYPLFGIMRYPFIRISRPRSRSQERFFSVSRLSCSFLPRASAISTLARPFLVEIELERHDGHALALDRADQPVDLALVQQQFARPLRRMIEAARLQIFRNVGIDQPDLAAARVGIGFCDRRLAGAQRFHLAAGEHDAGLECLADLVVEARLAVVGDHLEAALGFCGHRLAIAFSAISAGRGFR